MESGVTTDGRERPRCLVIGGSGALGRVLCAVLARRGARVALTYHRNEAAARAVCEAMGPQAAGRAFALDASAPGAVGAVVETAAREFGAGALDALVYAAALGTSRPGVYQRFDDIDEAGWDLLMAVNVRGAFAATQAFARCVPADGRGGNVVYMGSVDGAKPVPASLHYAVSKSALAGMARTAAKDLGPRNIRVNAVAPGIQEGGITSVVPDELRKEYLKHCGLKRYGRFEETAEVVAFLALENRYVSGRTIGVDGGL